ncbi:right-handed parallel beta-helix repeat-containing protein, partial [Citrobacter cronae]|uniref:right-handed parallel beta-helix repeat-containing protein n=2 Tax=Enterobacteriaceae TaxID=543 RepID=UPI00350F64C0
MAIKIIGGNISGNGGDGIYVGDGFDIEVIGTKITDNHRDGIHVANPDTNVSIQHIECFGNTRDGVHVAITMQDLVNAGLKENIPQEELDKAQKVIVENTNKPLIKIMSALKG